ncbi:DsbA family protein [Ewingella americana]|uniref:Thioredoxin-like protein n=2 Tax=Ewingella americana TaxID=41202 RepID=A0A085G0S8_EWIA3|nr:DsbA family protein [Ewingella americana]KAA8726560.1 DsbA family protein [Ewingella americana]KFC77323.1 thioredoxin-like protein [Ewingella americana ATCC 33852]STS10585.1 DSBA-like thioredoxin domain [Ewingella americana]
MQNFKLLYVFDPLCGWCYASAPALASLAAAFPQQLELMPSGLFSDAGAREMTPSLATHAWTNDQRIESLTGQVFSEKYFNNILMGTDVRFDSQAMNRALTAIRQLDASLETEVLHHLQHERYVNGQDTSAPQVVANIAAQHVQAAGYELDASDFALRLTHDEALAEQTHRRTQTTQSLMDKLAVRGVPLLLVQTGDQYEQISGKPLYVDPQALVAAISEKLSAAAR